MSKKANYVVHTTYTVHPDDVQTFVDVVRSHIIETRKEPGNVYYHFSWDIIDPTICVLAEGWTDEPAINIHLNSNYFQEALSGVFDRVELLDRKGTLYTVSGETDIIAKLTE